MAAGPLRHIGVVGAGTMGSGIAQACATAGFDVRVFDADGAAGARAHAAIRRSLLRFVEKGTLTADAVTATLARIAFVAALENLASADLVVEAIAENLTAKARLFEALARLTRPSTLLASNTSSVSITALGDASGCPSRVLGVHFMNPVPLMPLVELVRGRETDEASVALARLFCERLGKTVVEAADSPGFLTNRILMPMLNEAMFALMEGVGTAEGIDAVMTLGMRHPMGPLALADFIGLDVCLAILEVMHEGFGQAKYQPCPLLRELVAEGRLGRKSGQGFHRYQ